jgi:hypothetical protein
MAVPSVHLEILVSAPIELRIALAAITSAFVAEVDLADSVRFGSSRPGRAGSKAGHVRYGAESGSEIRVSGQSHQFAEAFSASLRRLAPLALDLFAQDVGGRFGDALIAPAPVRARAFRFPDS